MADREAIQELLARYAWASDERKYDELADVLTSDASYLLESRDGRRVGPYAGRAAIVDGVRIMKESQTDQRRHALSNYVFLEDQEDAAVVRYYLALYAVTPGLARLVTTGWGRAGVVRHGDGWRIKEKYWLFDTLT
jgi:3-phenylpropionate/cinnamic acid dioxygenase small subunit